MIFCSGKVEVNIIEFIFHKYKILSMTKVLRHGFFVPHCNVDKVIYINFFPLNKSTNQNVSFIMMIQHNVDHVTMF